jgi:hypothetical protein
MKVITYSINATDAATAKICNFNYQKYLYKLLIT